jgi:hypothetical protein
MAFGTAYALLSDRRQQEQELVGNFTNAGQIWAHGPTSDAANRNEALRLPYGLI